MSFMMKLRAFFKRFSSSRLMKRLPVVRGYLAAYEPLYKKNWFGVGGPAEIYFEPADTDDLIKMLSLKPEISLTILGAGSNVLIRDGGIPGMTIHLGKGFSAIRVQEDELVCGAGASLMEVARKAQKAGLSGFEFMCGIPGSVGGGVKMNAGAYGSCLQDVLTRISVVTSDGIIQEIDPRKTPVFSYRSCSLPPDWIVVEAVLKGKKAPPEKILEKMAENRKMREAHQPIGVRTAGSFFKNPDGLPAWKLIENAGLRSAQIGGAKVSEKHANFLINTGNASAADIEALGQLIHDEVLKREGIDLSWEVKKLGVSDD